jgi:hypothetical protein
MAMPASGAPRRAGGRAVCCGIRAPRRHGRQARHPSVPLTRRRRCRNQSSAPSRSGPGRQRSHLHQPGRAGGMGALAGGHVMLEGASKQVPPPLGSRAARLHSARQRGCRRGGAAAALTQAAHGVNGLLGAGLQGGCRGAAVRVCCRQLACHVCQRLCDCAPLCCAGTCDHMCLWHMLSRAGNPSAPCLPPPSVPPPLGPPPHLAGHKVLVVGAAVRGVLLRACRHARGGGAVLRGLGRSHVVGWVDGLAPL